MAAWWLSSDPTVEAAILSHDGCSAHAPVFVVSRGGTREGQRENRKIHVYRTAKAGTTVALALREHLARRATNSAHDVLYEMLNA